MSQTASPRTQRPISAMVIALLVVSVLAVSWYFLGRPDEDTRPVKTVDWAGWVKAGRAEQRLLTSAPAALPEGWRATSVRYVGGRDASWHLGLLTDEGTYVGIEESLESTQDLVEQYIDEDAERGEDEVVAGETWQTWTDAGGDFALVRSVPLDGRPHQSLLVGGSASADDVRELAESLEAGEITTG